MIAQVDRDGNGKISIEGKKKKTTRIFVLFFFSFFIEFAALVERES